MNSQNLVKYNEMTKEKKKTFHSKGGKKSAENKKERKKLSEQLKLALNQNIENKQLIEEVKKWKPKTKSPTYDDLITVALIQQAGKGNVKAYETIRNTIGEKPTDNIDLNTTPVPIVIDDIGDLSEAPIEYIMRLVNKDLNNPRRLVIDLDQIATEDLKIFSSLCDKMSNKEKEEAI